MSSVYEWSETESQSDDESVVVERKIPVLSITRRILINLAIPFINGIMLGFGEIFAHEIGVAYGWRQSRTSLAMVLLSFVIPKQGSAHLLRRIVVLS